MQQFQALQQQQLQQHLQHQVSNIEMSRIFIFIFVLFVLDLPNFNNS
jgi:hypothetical protein